MKRLLLFACIASTCWAMDSSDELSPQEKQKKIKEERAIARQKVEDRKLKIAERKLALSEQKLELTRRAVEAAELQALAQAYQYLPDELRRSNISGNAQAMAAMKVKKILNER